MSTAKKPLAKFEVQQKYPPKEKKKKKMVEDFVILNNYNDDRMTDVKRECQQKNATDQTRFTWREVNK